MYKLLVLVSNVLRQIPFPLVILFGKVAGILLYSFNLRKRLVAYRNLKMSFPSRDERELKRILKSAFVNFGVSLAEFFIFDKTIVNESVDISALKGLNKPHIFVGIHAGNWELYNSILARAFPFTILVKSMKENDYVRFLIRQRQSGGINQCDSLKALIRAIKNECWVGLVVDQGAEENAPHVRFFNHLVPTPQGAVYLARKYDRLIYPLYGYRSGPLSHKVDMGKPINPKGKTNPVVLEEINRQYESFLQEHPQEYMWWFKRYKRKKNLDILILSDKKDGHVKQTRTVINVMRELGYKVRETLVEVDELSFWHRALAEVLAFFSHPHFLGGIERLRFILPEHVFHKVKTVSADCVVSTGSQMAPLTAILSHSIGARSIVLLRPNVPLHKFSLAIIPEHDRIIADNIVHVKGVFSVPKDTSKDKALLEKQFSLKQGQRIAFFIGGPLEDEAVFRSNLRAFLPVLCEYARSRKQSLLVTTSRRTPQDIEYYLEKTTAHWDCVELLVLANKRNYPFVFGGFLGFAEMVFVSSDSISMISESAGAGKCTQCVCLEEIFNTHHINFYATMKEYLEFLRPPYKIAAGKTPSLPLYEYNKQKVKEFVASIF